MAAQVPNIFVEQYDQGQKKIRADLMDENFAYVCTQLDNNAAAADAAQGTADGKANADLDDVTAAGKAVMAHAASPSPRSIVMSVPERFTSIIAPGDGYICLAGASANGSLVHFGLQNNTNGLATRCPAYTAGVPISVIIPVSSGDEIVVSYGPNVNLISLTFVYVNGNAPTN